MKESIFYGKAIKDLPSSIIVDGVRKECPRYSVWRGMITRALCPIYKQRNPTYNDVIVCDEWLRFSNFCKWLETQIWEGLCLDKDLLVMGNREYNPNNCAFIPNTLNLLLRTNKAKRGIYPVGVYFKNDVRRTKPYRACVSLGKGMNKHLGHFETPMQAHHAWQWSKASIIEESISSYAKEDCFRTDVAEALTDRVWRLRLDHCRGLETFDL